ncbi:MAG TPA: nuclear transport factor 2 family protein [Vicinamibacterales bacterium]|nr:nuclear transport factor 2 family protein [Vicinamibacterales bacterium]
MRQRLSILTASIVLIPAFAFAHVSVASTPASAMAHTGDQAPAGHQMPPSNADAAMVTKWLADYDAAFNAKDLDKLATFYHPEVTIYEGGGINRGWADYRDHHLGPELKQFANLQFAHSNTVVRMIGPDAAYATAEYSLKAKMGERDIDSGGLETLVLIKEGGAWKIRHSHTSSRPRRPAAVK